MGNPCMECRSCRQIEAMQYSDLQVVEKLEDKSEIRKEQVDEVNRFLSLSPYESKSKTSILIDFQSASTEAQNALLKTLEEAPGNSMIIITVDSVDNLLPTTVSRCEVLNLRPITCQGSSLRPGQPVECGRSTGGIAGAYFRRQIWICPPAGRRTGSAGAAVNLAG